MNSDHFALPFVFCPSPEIRNLRRLFSTYQALNKTIVAQKNAIVGVLRDVGVKIGVNERYGLYNGKAGIAVLKDLELDEYVFATMEPLVTIIRMCTEKKKAFQKTIIAAGRRFKDDVELLISIKGITPLSALAFIADIADLS
jgi:transposase